MNTEELQGYSFEEILNTEILLRMSLRQATDQEEIQRIQEIYTKFCVIATQRKVQNSTDKKVCFTIGVIPDQLELSGLCPEKYFDVSTGAWCFEIILGNHISELLTEATGEYLLIMRMGEELCLDNLCLIYQLLKSKGEAGCYFYEEELDRGTTKVELCQNRDSTLSSLFLHKKSRGVFKRSFLDQLCLTEWLQDLEENGNLYVADYPIACCTYLIAMAAPALRGSLSVVRSSHSKRFHFRNVYVDNIIILLNQWVGIISETALLTCYRNLVKESFQDIRLSDTTIYISDEKCAMVRDKLLEGVERLKLHWPFNGIRFEKVFIRSEYNKLMKSNRISRLLMEWFYIQTGYPLDLENPVTFNQKLNWMKIYDNTARKTQLADKYAVRSWVAETIGEEYLIPLYGVWKDAKSIDFDSLPKQFVLKVNQGSGFNIVVPDKSKLNLDQTRKQLEEWLHTNYASYGFELQYQNIEPRIICEEYMENNGEGLHDYKVHVFHGIPHYIQFISGRTDKSQTAERFYDTNWNPQDFTYTNPRSDKLQERPAHLEELLKLAEILGQEFAYVRVDLYLLNNGQIKFGEMTFTPTNGMDPWNPAQMDVKLGKLISLDSLRKRTVYGD